jgi:phage terminase large subunit
MKNGLIKISPDCKDLITEMQGYVWDDKSLEDKPVKVSDHACDALRYFVKTKRILKQKRMIEKELVFL